jgi:hypothetical protein
MPLYIPNRSWQLIESRGGFAVHTGTTAETVLYTGVVPGGVMGANGGFRLWGIIDAIVNANIKRWRFKFGGTTLISVDWTSGGAGKIYVPVMNVGATNSQVSGGNTNVGFGGNGSAVATAAIDTTVNQNFEITGELVASAVDTMQIRQVGLEYIYAP